MAQPRKISTLKELRVEKQRLQREIKKTEDNIQAGYRNILLVLSFKNIAVSLLNDFTTTSSAVSKAFEFGKMLLNKRKKRKQEKVKKSPDDTHS